MQGVGYTALENDVGGQVDEQEIAVLSARATPLHRCLTHLAFFSLCCSYLFISSVPRLTAFIDFPLSLTLFLFPLRSGTVIENLRRDVLDYDIERSGCDLLLVALVRSVILFNSFAYRNQTSPSALKVSRSTFIISIVLVLLKLCFSSGRIRFLALSSLFITLVEITAFTLVRRRRILTPKPDGRDDDDGSMEVGVDGAPNVDPLCQTLVEPDSNFIEFEGLRIHYRFHRHPSSPHIIILLHGFGGGVFSWRQIWSGLTDFATVLAFDRPGFGLSSRPFGPDVSSRSTNPYAPSFSVHLTEHLMAKFDLTGSIIIGHSTGASLALIIASSMDPPLISALCLVSFTEITTLPSFVRSILVSRLGKSVILQLVRSELGQVSLRRSWYDPAHIPKQIIDDFRASLSLPHWSEALCEMVHIAEPHHCIDVCATQITCPVLIITGADDKLSSMAELERLAQSLHGRCRLIRLRECGHIPHQEHPCAFLDIIRRDVLLAPPP